MWLRLWTESRFLGSPWRQAQAPESLIWRLVTLQPFDPTLAYPGNVAIQAEAIIYVHGK
jgi:hypothetical protein